MAHLISTHFTYNFTNPAGLLSYWLEVDRNLHVFVIALKLPNPRKSPPTIHLWMSWISARIVDQEKHYKIEYQSSLDSLISMGESTERKDVAN